MRMFPIESNSELTCALVHFTTHSLLLRNNQVQVQTGKSFVNLNSSLSAIKPDTIGVSGTLSIQPSWCPYKQKQPCVCA